MTRKVLIPVYRERPPTESVENFRKLQKMRFLLTAAMFALTGAVSLAGVVLINLMYDPRYAMAGAVVVLIAAMQIPQMLVLTYEQAALAAGDSRRFFVLSAARAVLTLGCLVGGFGSWWSLWCADRSGGGRARGLSVCGLDGPPCRRVGSQA